MHSAFLWCSCHDQDKVHELAIITKQHTNPEYLPEFFWGHLCKDIEHLSRVTGKGLEESALTVHLVLRNIFIKDPPSCKDMILVMPNSRLPLILYSFHNIYFGL